MGSGDDTAAAGHSLRLLQNHFLQRPVTGADGHSYISSEPRPTRTQPGAPADLDVVDHIAASFREVVDDTLAANPAASPLPDRVDRVYAWCIDNTRNTSEAQQQRRDTVIYRQQLEHAIAMGDTSVVRPHRCPECGTVGLHWSAGKARCVNRHCAARNGGISRSWSLARLAYEYVASKKRLTDCAT